MIFSYIILSTTGQITQLGQSKRSFLSKSIANNPHSDKKHSVFVQIYIKRPTFGQKHLFIKCTTFAPHISRIGYSHAWQQGPSAQDIRTAKGNELVFGMGNGIIYKYNKNGVFATIPISIFK